MKLKKTIIKNTSSVDMEVTDAYGNRYTLFPEREKEVWMFIMEKKGGQCKSDKAGEDRVRKGNEY